MRGSIIVFRLPPGTSNTGLSKFCQRFYGQDTSSWRGKYRYHRRGLLEDVPHRKIIRGVLLVKSSDVEVVRRFLVDYDATIYTWDVQLNPEDLQALGS